MIVLMVVRPHLISLCFLHMIPTITSDLLQFFQMVYWVSVAPKWARDIFWWILVAREFLFSDDRRSTSALTFLQGGLLLVVNGVTTPIRGRKQMAFTGVPIHPEKVELFHPTYSLWQGPLWRMFISFCHFSYVSPFHPDVPGNVYHVFHTRNSERSKREHHQEGPGGSWVLSQWYVLDFQYCTVGSG